MLKANLLEIIANGENSGVEFKRDDIKPEDLAKEIVAFANFMGGVVLIGVENDGSISGIKREKLEEWVMNIFRNKIHPFINPYYEEILLEDKKVAVITIEQGTSKPYVVRHNDEERIYIRMGSTSRTATREQQARLYDMGGMLHAETLPVSGTSMESLDLERIKSYLTDIIDDPEMPASEAKWQERLVGLGFLQKRQNQNNNSSDETVATIAGIITFGITPRRYLPQSGIRLMVFDGVDKTYKAVFDDVIAGSLFNRVRRTKSGLLETLDLGLIDNLADKIRPFIYKETGNIADNMQRERFWLYPWEAVRETIINAIAHRDYTRSLDIEISIYSDRMEIISPGALPNSMNLEKMKAGQRSPRNPLIVSMLRDYGYVDARGMGVRTKIIPLLKQHNNKEPDFIATDDYLKTVLYA